MEMESSAPAEVRAARSRRVKGGGKATGSCLQLGQLPRKGQAAEGFWRRF